MASFSFFPPTRIGARNTAAMTHPVTFCGTSRVHDSAQCRLVSQGFEPDPVPKRPRICHLSELGSGRLSTSQINCDTHCILPVYTLTSLRIPLHNFTGLIDAHCASSSDSAKTTSASYRVRVPSHLIGAILYRSRMLPISRSLKTIHFPDIGFKVTRLTVAR
ncbi:hypothetical protein CPB85DRAFT_91630 [Mucidula mucida]|nr:hypothetical protein CPB85DRAFT_91630 [Mucidula mucida]